MGQQVRYGRRRSHGAGALIAAVILVVAALIAAWTLLPRLFTPRETARTRGSILRGGAVRRSPPHLDA